MSIHHVLITLMNLPRVSSHDASGIKTVSTEWTRKRLYIFEKTAPFRKKGDSYRTDANFTPWYISHSRAWIHELKDYLRTKAPVVITTLIDSDDLLHRDAIRIIKSCLSAKPMAIFNFNRSRPGNIHSISKS